MAQPAQHLQSRWLGLRVPIAEHPTLLVCRQHMFGGLMGVAMDEHVRPSLIQQSQCGRLVNVGVVCLVLFTCLALCANFAGVALTRVQGLG